MNQSKLINTYTLSLQLIAVVVIGLYIFLFGSPTLERPEIGSRPLKNEQKVELTQDQALKNMRQEFLISERRPGHLSHVSFEEKDGQLWGRTDNQWKALLSIDPKLQKIAEKTMRRGRVALGSFVAMELDTGRVLALSEYVDRSHPTTRALNLKDDIHVGLLALAPAAGLFKVVTTAALLEANFKPMERFCYRRAGEPKSPADLQQSEGAPCSNLMRAFADVDHGFISSAAHQKLKPEDLTQSALNLGFNQPLAHFDLPHEMSAAFIPNSDLQRARTSLGLINSRASTLHGAMIASAIATDGRLIRPRIVEKLVQAGDGDGEEEREVDYPAQELESSQIAFSPATASILRFMMRKAIQEETTYKVFSQWPSELKFYQVAGQASQVTVSINPLVRYTWFVGFFPIEDPKVAVSVMVLNNRVWYARALDIAHRVLREYLLQNLPESK